MSDKAAKIQDVAKAAGVSTATVSRALSAPEKVSEPTRQAVLAAVEATGYRVNQAARSLRTRRAGSVLVLVPNLSNPFFSQIIAGIESRLSAAGLKVVVTDTGPGAGAQALTEPMRDGHADGIICLDGNFDPAALDEVAQSRHAARIVFACEWVDGSPFPSVRSDNAHGVRMAMDHLFALGHRDIGLVQGPRGNVLTAARTEAFAAAMAAQGLAVQDNWMFRGDFSLESGRDAALFFAQGARLPTAVFCASDLMAHAMIGQWRAMNIRVPQDVSVVGFDDIEVSEYLWPPLTTIRQARETLGSKAAELLLDRILGRAHGAPAIHVPVSLVVRATTAAPRS